MPQNYMFFVILFYLSNQIQKKYDVLVDIQKLLIINNIRKILY